MMESLSVLGEYSFLVVALGTTLLAMSSSILGSVNILKGQSLIGDSIGHASFLGVVIAFMITMQRNPFFLMIGAVIAGILAYTCINLVVNHSKIHADTAMAIILSAFFGFGMVLKSYIQGNPAYSKASQSGLAGYIFGQAAYIVKADVGIIFGASLLAIVLFLMFYKEIKIHVFDDIYAKTVGIRKNLMSTWIMLMTMILIAAGLKAVGIILISSMLITPAVVGMQWSDRYDKVLMISAVTAAVCAFVGTILSSLIEGFSTGPSIVLIMSSLALFSVVFSPKGMLQVWIRRRIEKKTEQEGEDSTKVCQNTAKSSQNKEKMYQNDKKTSRNTAKASPNDEGQLEKKRREIA